MDEESTTVAVSFLLRGRWYNTAIDGLPMGAWPISAVDWIT